MRVRFIGREKRVNSFGEFNPDRTYDVSTEVGETLLTIPDLFRLEEAGMRRAKTADKQILDVTTEINDKYKIHNMAELYAMTRERGINTRRGARKAELIKLLEDDDKEKENESEASDLQNT